MASRDVVAKCRERNERRAIEKFRQRLEKRAQIPRPALRSNQSPLMLPENQRAASPSDQASSLFFSKLTFDTRQQVYLALLQSRCFHIVERGARLAFLFCCAKDGISHTKYGCWGFHDYNGRFLRRDYHLNTPKHELPWYHGNGRVELSTDGGFLPLLLTCRLAYVEVIGMLYSSNLFAFTGLSTLSSFRSNVPLQCLAKIRHLHIEVMCDYYGNVIYPHYTRGLWRTPRTPGPPQPDFQQEIEWIEFWESIDRLQGVKTLEVHTASPPAFWIGYRNSNKRRPTDASGAVDLGDALLGPLRAMKKLERFEVILTDIHPLEVKDDEPFQVRLQDFRSVCWPSRHEQVRLAGE